MKKILIIKFLAEGGSAEIFGRQIRGSWRYWQEGSFMSFGEDDAIEWKHNEYCQLQDAFPESWYRLHPSDIHPDFLAEIRQVSSAYFNKIKEQYKDILDAEIRWNNKIKNLF